MPVHSSPPYKPAVFFLGPHIETLTPYLLRKVANPPYRRERVELPDGDFLDLDWTTSSHNKLLILCHGLEGSSQSQYMKGMTKAASLNGYDVVCINFRSCSGELNRKLRLYHHGEITDLTFIVDQILDRDRYRSISLCGFSLGGNVILKYLGTLGSQVPDLIHSAVAVSVPCDLASSSEALDQWYNYLYTRRFMGSLKSKFEQKDQLFPGIIEMEKYDRIKTWQEFDDTFTTKVTGFANAEEYYQQGSANNFIRGIHVPTLIINAKNDPFLAEPSYPESICRDLNHVYLEMPRYGGHVGFWFPSHQRSFAEERVIDFIKQVID